MLKKLLNKFKNRNILILKDTMEPKQLLLLQTTLRIERLNQDGGYNTICVIDVDCEYKQREAVIRKVNDAINKGYMFRDYLGCHYIIPKDSGPFKIEFTSRCL